MKTFLTSLVCVVVMTIVANADDSVLARGQRSVEQTLDELLTREMCLSKEVQFVGFVSNSLALQGSLDEAVMQLNELLADQKVITVDLPAARARIVELDKQLADAFEDAKKKGIPLVANDAWITARQEANVTLVALTTREEAIRVKLVQRTYPFTGSTNLVQAMLTHEIARFQKIVADRRVAVAQAAAEHQAFVIKIDLKRRELASVREDIRRFTETCVHGETVKKLDLLGMKLDTQLTAMNGNVSALTKEVKDGFATSTQQVAALTEHVKGMKSELASLAVSVASIPLKSKEEAEERAKFLNSLTKLFEEGRGNEEAATQVLHDILKNLRQLSDENAKIAGLIKVRNCTNQACYTTYYNPNTNCWCCSP